MSARVRLSARAHRDIGDIGRDISRHNAQAAERLLLRLASSMESLERHPLSGSPRDDMGIGTRILVVGNYVIYYRYIAEERVARVSRIIHGARDAAALLQQDRADN